MHTNIFLVSTQMFQIFLKEKRIEYNKIILNMYGLGTDYLIYKGTEEFSCNSLGSFILI